MFASLFLWGGLTLILAVNPILVGLHSTIRPDFFPIFGGVVMIVGWFLLLFKK